MNELELLESILKSIDYTNFLLGVLIAFNIFKIWFGGLIK